jgi:hypothetical protein
VLVPRASREIQRPPDAFGVSQGLDASSSRCARCDELVVAHAQHRVG